MRWTPAPITGFLLTASDTAPESCCWQVYVENSSGRAAGLGHPFGFLRLKQGASIVCLHVLPYNYPTLFRLLEQLPANPPTARANPPNAWRMDFEKYLAGIPPYYLFPLKAVFKKLGLPAQLIPEPRDRGLSAPVTAQLKRMQHQARQELEEHQKSTWQLLFEAAPAVATAILCNARAAEERAQGAGMPETPSIYRDPFAVPKGQLLRGVEDLSRRLSSLIRPSRALPTSVEAERVRFNVPISVMGDYVEAAKKTAPLRDPMLDDEERARRSRFAFGNPFLRDRARATTPGIPGFGNLAVDETVGEADVLGVALEQMPQLPKRPKSASRDRPTQSPSGTPGEHPKPPADPAQTASPAALPKASTDEVAAADAKLVEPKRRKTSALRKRLHESSMPCAVPPGVPSRKRGCHRQISAADVEVLLQPIRYLQQHRPGVLDCKEAFQHALDDCLLVKGVPAWVEGVEARARAVCPSILTPLTVEGPTAVDSLCEPAGRKPYGRLMAFVSVRPSEEAGRNRLPFCACSWKSYVICIYNFSKSYAHLTSL
eukprot:jgi/Botrbrau1/6298/Bobra.0339s0009.1